MRTRSVLSPAVVAALGAIGAAWLAACSSSPTLESSSTGNATGTSGRGTAPTDTTVTGSTGTSAPGDQGAASGAGGASGGQGGGANGNGGGGNGGGGGGTAPRVTSATGPGTVSCPDQTSTVSFTAHYAVVNAKYIEYLQPGSARPGAGDANGSVMLNYNCASPSATYQIRAFNEFNGSDAKDPSPYVSFTVTRKLTTSSSSSSSSSTSSSKPSTPNT